MFDISQLHQNWGANGGYACITVIPERKQSFYRWPSEASELRAAFNLANEKQNAYISWCLFDSHSRLAVHASVVPGILLDIDISTGNHAAKNLPNSEEEALALLPIKPSRVVRSGGGLYAQYLFPEPFVIRSESDRENVASLLVGFEQGVRARFTEKGLKLDAVSDLPRITRPVGALNHKYEPVRTVTLLDDSGVRYSMDELRKYVVVAGSPAPTPSVSGVSNDSGDFLLVEKYCGVVKRMATHPAEVSEPTWHGVATVAAHTFNGAERFHALSALDSKRYNRAETEAKLNAAKHSSKPRTCERFNEPECMRCPFRAAPMQSPVALAYGDPTLLQLQAANVFSTGDGLYYPGKFTREAFNDKFAHLFSKVPHKEFVMDMRSPKVDGVDYIPGERRSIVDSKLNTWVEGGVEAAAGDCSILIEHFEKLISKSEEREWVFAYLASLTQRPSQKIKSAVLLQGGQGIGKSALGGLLGLLWGPQNTFVDSGGIHASSYLSSLGNRQVLVIEEMDQASKRDTANAFKPWITEDFVQATEKYQPVRPVRTPRGIFIFTNFAVPTVLERDDRRYLVIRSDMEKPDKAYFNRLFGEGMKQASAFKRMLLERDISNWNPHAAPPITEAKCEVIEQGRSNTAIAVEEWIAARDRELVTTREVLDALNPLGQPERYSLKQVYAAFNELGYRRLEATKVAGGSAFRPWATRNIHRWLNSEHHERQSYFAPSGTNVVSINRKVG